MLKAGTKAPDFQLRDDTGRVETLSGRLAHGPVVLAFFKISCPTCQYTFPFLDRMYREHAVPVVGISQDDAEETRDFRDAFHVTFPTVLDSAGSGYPVSNQYRITHVPSLFLVEPDGRIAVSEYGFSRTVLESIAERFGGVAFRPAEQVPQFKPG